MDEATRQKWINLFYSSEAILDQNGDALGSKGRGLVARMRFAGMSAIETEAALQDLKKIRGNPWPYCQRIIAGWRAKKEREARTNE